VLGFDHHSSGMTTLVCGALKEAAKKRGNDLSIIVCGGKGVLARKTPDEIRNACEKTGDPAESLVYASKTAAKVDSAAVQDGYELYHHTFIFVPGQPVWCVIQQGMDEKARHFRRYHWLSDRMASYVADPHIAIVSDRKADTLNLVASEGEQHRNCVTALSREHPDRILRELRLLRDHRLPIFDRHRNGTGSNLGPKTGKRNGSLQTKELNPTNVKKVLLTTHERQAPEFEQLLGEVTVGADTLRSLSLLAELIYHAPASRRDPAGYSFAHGGKDGHPFRMNRRLYDQNIERLRQAIETAKIESEARVDALHALGKFTATMV
jgi:hypothetical protein